MDIDYNDNEDDDDDNESSEEILPWYYDPEECEEYQRIFEDKYDVSKETVVISNY